MAVVVGPILPRGVRMGLRNPLSPVKNAYPRGVSFRAALLTMGFYWGLAAPTKGTAAVPQVKTAGARVCRRRYMYRRTPPAVAAGRDSRAADASRCSRQRRSDQPRRWSHRHWERKKKQLMRSAWCSAPRSRGQSRTGCSGRAGLRCGGTRLVEELVASHSVHLRVGDEVQAPIGFISRVSNR